MIKIQEIHIYYTDNISKFIVNNYITYMSYKIKIYILLNIIIYNLKENFISV